MTFWLCRGRGSNLATVNGTTKLPGGIGLNATREFVKLLAHRLLDHSVIFLVGAGLSSNWEVPLARDLARLLVEQYRKWSLDNPGVPNLLESLRIDLSNGDEERCVSNIEVDLGDVAGALSQNKCWFLREIMRPIVESVKNPAFCKPPAELNKMDPVAHGHIGMTHVIIGRLAMEGLIHEIVTTNYDTLIETGCYAVGMVEYRNTDPAEDGYQFSLAGYIRSFRVVSDVEDFTKLVPRRSIFHVYKIHGCNVALLKAINAVSPCRDCTAWHDSNNCNGNLRNLTYAITRAETLNWRRDFWARDLFQDRARSHHLVLLGYGASDPALVNALLSVYGEAMPDKSMKGSERIQAVAADGYWNIEMLLRAIGSQPQRSPHNRLLYLLEKRKDSKGGTSRRSEGCEGKESNDPTEESFANEIDELFEDVYVETVKGMILRKLDSEGLLWLESISVASRKPLTVYQMRRFMEEGIEKLPQYVWVHVLPKLLTVSWLLNEPLDALVRGVSRLEAPHLYVPFNTNERYYFPLLALCIAFANFTKPFPRANASFARGSIYRSWHPNGWVEVFFPPVGEDPACRLLLLPSVSNAAGSPIRRPILPREMLVPPANFHRPGSLAAIVQITRGDKQTTTMSGRRIGVEAAFALASIPSVEIPAPVLFDKQTFTRTLRQIVRKIGPPTTREVRAV